MKDPETVNEAARELYHKEVRGLIEILNKDIGEGKLKLYTPDLKFRRAIGTYKGQRFSAKGDPLDEEAYARHLEEVVPAQKDREELRNITKTAGWIAATS